MGNERVMADTSVWIDFFKRGNTKVSKEMVKLIESDQLFICGMIELEIIQGLRDKERINVMNVIDVLHFVKIERDDYRYAGRLLNSLRQKGITIPPSDALIASCCIKNNLKLITYDKDFKYFKKLNKHIFVK